MRAVSDVALAYSFEMRQPDNVVVAEDGSLWVAGHHQFVGDFSCTDIEGACPWQYSVARIDPATMEGEILFTHEGPPMGFATVALPVGDRLYLGSAAGMGRGIDTIRSPAALPR